MRRCERCNRSFGDQKALEQHFHDSSAHSHSSSTCVLCNKTFVHDEALQQHLRDSPAHGPGEAKRAVQKIRARPPNRAETRISFKFPQLNKAVADAVSPFMTSPRFHEGNDQTAQHEYQTFVMAKFTCNHHEGSPRIWSSKKVAIVIRAYGKKGYNAVVYNQRCETCDNLGQIDLDESSYVDRVSYRLKMWAGVQVEHRNFSRGDGPPHKGEFCEGCKAGYCQRPSAGFY